MVYSALAGNYAIYVLLATHVLFASSRNDLPPTNARQVKRMPYVGMQLTEFAFVQMISFFPFASQNTQIFRSEREREFVPSFL